MPLRVAIVMGSDSDWPTVQEASRALDKIGVSWEAQVMSAHRSPDIVREFALSAAGNGIGVIIAAAGGAAHLAGVIAAHTTLPVIGVPMETASLGGLDSLLSTVQMPAGVPVATMAIGTAGAGNAGLFAAQILAISDPLLRERLASYRRELAAQVEEKNKRLQESVGKS